MRFIISVITGSFFNLLSTWISLQTKIYRSDQESAGISCSKQH